MQNVPDGYYDEIEYTGSKLNQILERFKDYQPCVRTCEDDGFDYLYEKEYCICIKNPSNSEELCLELAGEFSLFFNVWHSHYFTYEYDFNEMLQDTDEILVNEKCVVSFENNGKSFMSMLWQRIAPENQNLSYIKSLITDETRKTMSDYFTHDTVAHIKYWDTNLNYCISLKGI